ncbi:hypothetical protein HYH02_009426 [Chlamydomonas schloesseri]|uniref:Uncharacterized protein n=1 Tax=Chlamydomonas schloesseri TaxID=2026947 RepID=A0A835TPR7_9CHLO|nr:hypothetical protein HYH02_009426 [Chlamydomonas schloesseri]|eukprot:KAG2443010.1 hypothetical protein HYH02_009426 [Chlamydomonas schloesseri]
MASMETKNEVAQEKYGKDFEELSGKERQSVGGTIGGNIRKEAGTDYSEMGKEVSGAVAAGSRNAVAGQYQGGRAVPGQQGSSRAAGQAKYGILKRSPR